jgi:hypothetical protein
VPFVLYPKFGENGFIFTVIVAVIVSVMIIGTIFTGKKEKENKNG